MSRRDRGAGAGARTATEHAARSLAARRFDGRERIRAYHRFSARPSSSRARASSPRRLRRASGAVPAPARRAGARLRAARAPPRRRCSRPHRRAHHHRRRGDRPLRAEKDRRGLLDYDDLIDKTLRCSSERSRRLGALQARPRHRPRADRRGAGHEPEAMGDRRAARRRVLRRRRRARQSPRTMFAVGDEKQSIYSFQGAEPAQFAEMRRHLRARSARRSCASRQ